MNDAAQDKVFAGSIPALYDTQLVPLIFAPYAVDLVDRLLPRPLADVLEVAAGTGVVTRELAARLPDAVAIVATDLNPPMLAQAEAVGTRRPVTWRQADAMQLPFADTSFDAVVCQFGAMFFPDKAQAFAEARRVLRPGGVFLFNVWGRIEDNEFADVVTTALAGMFPDDPPRFLARTPHGHGDAVAIGSELAKAGFTAPPRFTTVTARSRAASAAAVAFAYCQGTPLRNEIEARGASRLGEATELATHALAKRFGRGAVEGKIQALVVEAVR